MTTHRRISGARKGGLTKWFNEKWVDIGTKEALKNFKKNRVIF